MARRNKKNLEHFAEEAQVIATARASEEVVRDNEIADLQGLLTDVRVRKLLWRVMEQTQMFADPMNSNFGLVGHSLGKAAVGKWLMGEIVEADYQAWLTMQTEHYEREIQKAAIAAAEDLSEPAS